MAKPRINYGERQTTAVISESPSEQPLYLLLEGTSESIAAGQAGGDNEPIPVSGCMCPDCQKMFYTPIMLPKRVIRTGDAETSLSAEIDTWNLQSELRANNPNVAPLQDLSCPECGKTGRVMALVKQRTGGWLTPQRATKRTLSEYRDGDELTRIDDRITLKGLRVTDRTHDVEPTERAITEVTDLKKNDIYVTSADITEDRTRTNETVTTSVDPFAYDTKWKLSGQRQYGVRRAKDMTFGTHTGLGWNQVFAKTFSETYEGADTEVVIAPGGNVNSHVVYPYETSARRDQLSEKFNREKLRLIEGRFSGMLDTLYGTMANNGMYLSAHHPGSNEENESLDPDIMSWMGCMMVRYPSALMYAMERTDFLLKNRENAQIRAHRDKGETDYVYPEPSDSAKAKVFREQVFHVAEELCAADDKILKAMRGTMTADQMRKSLEFFAFGPNGERAVPPGIKLQSDGTTMQDPFAATKALNKAFKFDPIATASNVYTACNYGIKKTDHLNQLNKAAAAFTETTPSRVRRRGRYVEVPPPSSDGINAGIVAPVRGTTMRQFGRRYANSHNHTEVIQAIYGDCAGTVRGDTTTGFGLYIECLQMFEKINKECKIADTAEEIHENSHEIMKGQIRAYLQQKTLSEGYVDFIERFGPDTPTVLNGFAREILQDRQMQEAANYRNEHGLAAAVERFPVLQAAEDPGRKLDDWLEQAQQHQDLVLTTRNGKPLFKNRNLREIHDELAEMSKKNVRNHTTYTYTEEERKLETSYPAPDAEGEWSFHLMADSLDLVRTATELHNCVASYGDKAAAKTSTLLYMQDETAKKVGCIELKNDGKREDGSIKWRVTQFQGDHDDAMPKRYSDIALQWLKDNKINYSGCSDVAKFGTGASFYGGHDLDLHHQEVDEAEGVTRTIAEMKTVQQARLEKAREIYGTTEDGSPNVPQVPDDLAQFS